MKNEYSYLIFATDGRSNTGEPREPKVNELVARVKSISDALSIINTPDLAEQTIIVLRYSKLTIGTIWRFGKSDWSILRLEHYPEKGSQDLLNDMNDQIAASEIIFASVNLYNSTQLGDNKSFKHAHGVLNEDETQSIRILRNQLEGLHGIETNDDITLLGVLRLWWDVIKNDQEKHS